MISRIASLLLLLYALGFILFAFTLGQAGAADAQATDAAVVLTGGAGRIEHAIDELRQGKAKRLLVAGADPSVTKARSRASHSGQRQSAEMLCRPW